MWSYFSLCRECLKLPFYCEKIKLSQKKLFFTSWCDLNGTFLHVERTPACFMLDARKKNLENNH